jgi:hypothetical protein
VKFRSLTEAIDTGTLAGRAISLGADSHNRGAANVMALAFTVDQ